MGNVRLVMLTKHQPTYMLEGSRMAAEIPQGMTSKSGKQADMKWGRRKVIKGCRLSRK